MLRDYYFVFCLTSPEKLPNQRIEKYEEKKNTIIVRLTDTTNSSLFDFRDMKTPPLCCGK